MRKISMLLGFVAMVAMVTPAMGANWVGPQVGNFNVGANWDPVGVPGTGDYAKIRAVYGTPEDPDRSGAIVTVTADTYVKKGYIGYGTTASGHLIVDSDVTYEVQQGYIGLGIGLNRDPSAGAVPPVATLTVSAGRVLADHMSIGYTSDAGPLKGHGKLTISGGILGSWWSCLSNGNYHAGSSSEGLGIFRIEGDAAQIGTSATYHEYVRGFKQTSISRTEFVLTSAGAVSPVNTKARASHTYENMRTSLEGVIQIDTATNGYTPAVGDKVALCIINNGITGYSRDDLLNYKAGDDLDNPGTPSPVTLEAPAGWGLIDDGLGTLSAKFTLGDVTESGYVDGSDLDEVLAKWGQTQVLDDVDPRWLGDVTCDEIVDGSDLDYILSGWGQGTPPPVPEPITLSLLGIGGLALLKRRRQ